MNKSIQFVFAGLALCFATISHAASFPTPPANSPYMTDAQTSYAQDPTTNVFSSAGNISCMISLMTPEQHVGTGQYLAQVDQNLCNASSGGSTTTSGTSAVPQPSWVLALLTVTQNTDSSLDVIGGLYIVKDGDGKSKNIQIHATIWGGAQVLPPYGKWTMKFCSTLTTSAAGSCSDGSGYIAVDQSGVTLYQGNGTSHQAGLSVYTATDGSSGYGILQDTGNNPPTSGKFRFAPGAYLYNDTQANSQACYDPRLSNPDVRYSTWQNFLYDQTTGQKVAYSYPGFYISEHGTSNQIGEFSYQGVNFWSNDSSAQANANVVDGPDGTVYNVHRTPGSLQKIVTKTGSMDLLDGATINYSVWGSSSGTSINPGSYIKSICSDAACQAINANTSNLNLVGTWSKANSSFTFTGFVDYSNNGTVTNFSSPITKTMSSLQSAGVSNFSGWVSGANINYNAQLSYWANNQNNYYSPVSAIPVTSQSNTTLAPTDSSIAGVTLYCVGTCPASSNGQLTQDVSSSTWPPTTSVAMTWNASIGAPVLASGVAVDWTSASLNPNQTSHYYQLYTAAEISQMDCPYWSGGVNHTTGGLCTNQVQTPANGQSTTYYSYSSGGQWNSYAYLTNASNGQIPAVNPPITLTYTVPSIAGNTRSLWGNQISIQSPQPGNIWLPGHCVDLTGAQAVCNSTNQWVSDVNIPTAQDATGTVNLLNTTTGAATSTNYYVKWLQRGVYYKSMALSQCSALDLSVTNGLTLPTASLIDPNVAKQSFPTSSAFQSKPAVVNGVQQ